MKKKDKCLKASTMPITPNTCIPPAIVSNPQSILATVGDSPTFSVVASGTSLQYQWRKDGLIINGATSRLLPLQYVSANDVGSYTVDIYNGCGLKESVVALLVVNAGGGGGGGVSLAPFITSDPSSADVVIGDAVLYNVTATGAAPLAYQWQKNGINIAGATSKSYSIPSAGPGDVAGYHCVVTNAYGFAVSVTAGLAVHAAGGTGGGALIGNF